MLRRVSGILRHLDELLTFVSVLVLGSLPFTIFLIIFDWFYLHLSFQTRRRLCVQLLDCQQGKLFWFYGKDKIVVWLLLCIQCILGFMVSTLFVFLVLYIMWQRICFSIRLNIKRISLSLLKKPCKWSYCCRFTCSKIK